MHGAVDMYSSLNAAMQSQMNCSIHEDCDGSCTGQRFAFNPVRSPSANFRLTISARPREVPPGYVRRNTGWLDQQLLEDFVYEPLPSSTPTIRLLKLKNAIFRDEVVECDLVDAALENNPAYVALSYSWGPPEFDHRIIVNGKVAMITKSLHDALKSCRRASYVKSHRTAAQPPAIEGPNTDSILWADALCINQRDTKERTSQVLLMRRIYSTASSVRIDLGYYKDDWFQGFDILHKLNLVWEHEGGESSPHSYSNPQEVFQKYGLPSPEHFAWRAYMFLFQSPWFTRTWVLQEVALAKEAIVTHGGFSFTWNQLTTSFCMYSRIMPISAQHSGSPEQNQGVMNLGKITQLLRFYARDRSPLAWIYAMRVTRDFKVTDPRDKIIGIHGIVNEQPIGQLQTFLADYTVTVDTLYHRFAIHLADTYLAQPMLNFAGLHRRNETITIPSWAPDWSAQGRHVASVPLGVLRPQPYLACGMSAPGDSLGLSRRSEDPDILVMMGDIIDTVIETSDFLLGGQLEAADVQARQFLSWHSSAHDLFTRIIMKNQPPAAGFDSRVNSFATTLLANDRYTGQNAVQTSSPIHWPQLTYEAVIEAMKKTAAGERDLITDWNHMDSVDTFTHQMLVACYGRKFAVTERRYMALVPHCTETGDRIAIILGAPVPFVVRESGDVLGKGDILERKLVDFRQVVNLVGDAYVHGIMEGEALESEDFAPQDILIR